MKTVLPQLYNETIKRKELIREVEMGPFKHEVRGGVEIIIIVLKSARFWSAPAQTPEVKVAFIIFVEYCNNKLKKYR